MKKLYSTIMMLAMMVAALGLTACGGDDDNNDIGGGISSTNYLEVIIDGTKYTQQYELPFVAITLPSDVDNSLWLSSSVEEEFGGNLNFGIAIYHKSDINALLGSSTGTYNVIGNKLVIYTI